MCVLLALARGAKQMIFQLFFVLGLFLALFFVQASAQACTTNCGIVSDIQDSGFVTNSENVSPLANVNHGFTPSPKIKNPSTATVIIWLHGHVNSRKRQSCKAQQNHPPRSVLQLGKEKNTFIYYHCSSVTDNYSFFKKKNVPDDGVYYTGRYANGSYTLERRDEVEDLIDDFLKIGVKPSNITLAGHSAGGWTALLAAAAYPEKFHAVIAFAPAFAGSRSKASVYPYWRGIVRPEQIEIMTQPNNIPKLVFAYEDDDFNRPRELSFLTEAFPVSVTLISQNCSKGHSTHRKDCQLSQTVSLMKDVIYTEKSIGKADVKATDGIISTLTSMIYDVTGYELGKILDDLFDLDFNNLTIVRSLREFLSDISEFFNRTVS